MELDQDGQLGIGTGNPTVKLQVAGDISGSRLYTQGSTSPMVNLERTDSAGNAAIQFKNTNGFMIAGVDEDAQNSGANIFGIGYYGDLIDNDGSNHATFVVTGSQVVVNNATSASNGAALTVGGTISGKTFKSEKIFSYLVSGQADGTEYFFPIGSHYIQSVVGAGITSPTVGFTMTAMTNLSITKIKLQFAVPCSIASGDNYKIYCKKWNGSGNFDASANWTDVGTVWTVKENSAITDNERFFHAPTDWNISAGEIWGMAFEINGNDSLASVFNGGIVIEEDWNNQVSS